MSREHLNLGQSWSPNGFSRRNPRELQLVELSILRRLDAGEQLSAIAAALGISRGHVSNVRTAMRTAFGVSTDKELLAHPDVRRQMGR